MDNNDNNNKKIKRIYNLKLIIMDFKRGEIKKYKNKNRLVNFLKNN